MGPKPHVGRSPHRAEHVVKWSVRLAFVADLRCAHSKSAGQGSTRRLCLGDRTRSISRDVTHNRGAGKASSRQARKPASLCSELFQEFQHAENAITRKKGGGMSAFGTYPTRSANVCFER